MWSNSRRLIRVVQCERPGGLDISTRGREHSGRKGLSASPFITSPPRPPLLVDSIDLPNKQVAAWPLQTRRTNKQTLSCQNHQARLCQRPHSSRWKTNKLEMSQKTIADLPGCSLTRGWVWDSRGGKHRCACRNLVDWCLSESCNDSVAVSSWTLWLLKTSVSKKVAAGLMSPQASSQCCDYWRLPSLICVIPIFSDLRVRALRGDHAKWQPAKALLLEKKSL